MKSKDIWNSHLDLCFWFYVAEFPPYSLTDLTRKMKKAGQCAQREKRERFLNSSKRFLSFQSSHFIPLPLLLPSGRAADALWVIFSLRLRRLILFLFALVPLHRLNEQGLDWKERRSPLWLWILIFQPSCFNGLGYSYSRSWSLSVATWASSSNTARALTEEEGYQGERSDSVKLLQ